MTWQNGISHSHWMKICDDHNGQINLRAKQKYEVLSATDLEKPKRPQETCGHLGCSERPQADISAKKNSQGVK